MRNYQIYWIEEMFVQHYYGRERIFFQLFSEWEASSGELHDIISKQVDYITKPIPYLPTQRILQHEIMKIEGSAWVDSIATIERLESGATLVLHEKWMTLNAWGSDESEYIFFEILRRNIGQLLAIDIQNERFGWLKPIKQRKFIY
ncbi:sporulation inhibitor of replication protein SirA (plasmid) [Cytobacillus spongiae]|uniref:sporulation inhibitor of replication protein SirA n=1 Tax=Cytobacillus spongiae TaxID=2901381 RepID=UPI00145D0CE6|nr:sporulation inhibitor of replication protein SirA [Cytobacillus spongiae]MCA1062504.1 sporulation inhibitor of replication protein SirA [Rossellomorea aquimaris]NMH71053.1 sporulation inhibitor of replication protein SirA [Bacillus sp. RO3]UII58142.1 sporulation inhibitor of replication protein SirA [Cytobacillus spongiae]WJV28809.1 sporulation inhibitor of replication protein SirA [Rossellomorea sp. AcN35-11]